MSFICSKCEISFTRKDNLTRHLKMKHGGESEFKCRICQKNFTQSENLQNHLRDKHTVQVDDVMINDIPHTSSWSGVSSSKKMRKATYEELEAELREIKKKMKEFENNSNHAAIHHKG